MQRRYVHVARLTASISPQICPMRLRVPGSRRMRCVDVFIRCRTMRQ